MHVSISKEGTASEKKVHTSSRLVKRSSYLGMVGGGFLNCQDLTWTLPHQAKPIIAVLVQHYSASRKRLAVLSPPPVGIISPSSFDEVRST